MIRTFGLRTEQPGITTEHVFSAGAHYDPANLAHGPVIGCDRHTVAAGAGFDWHAHRGVVIVSWVTYGALRHEDDSGDVRVVPAGDVLVQCTGSGIRHTETNASDSVPLIFVQTTILADCDRSVVRPEPPIELPGGAVFRVAREVPDDFGGFAARLSGDLLVVVDLPAES